MTGVVPSLNTTVTFASGSLLASTTLPLTLPLGRLNPKSIVLSGVPVTVTSCVTGVVALYPAGTVDASTDTL